MPNNNIEHIERKTRGRQRVPMVHKERKSNRQATFTKRRNGLFKKASELCTLCGAQTAIILFSPGRKVFSFGHPSVDTTINRFLAGDSFFNHPNYDFANHEDPNLLSSNMNITIINNQVKSKKEETQRLLDTRKSRAEEFKWIGPIQDIGLEDLKRFQETLGELVANTYQQYPQWTKDVNNARATVRSAFPSEMVEEENPIFVHPHLMVPTNLVEGQNNYDHSQMMIQPSMGGFGDPTLTMGSNGISLNHLLNTKASYSVGMNVEPSMPNPMKLGFSAPNFHPVFQGENNLMEDGQFGKQPPLPQLNMHGMNPISSHFQNLTPSLIGGDGPNAPIPTYYRQGRFGFGDGMFY